MAMSLAGCLARRATRRGWRRYWLMILLASGLNAQAEGARLARPWGAGVPPAKGRALKGRLEARLSAVDSMRTKPALTQTTVPSKMQRDQGTRRLNDRMFPSESRFQ